MTEIPIECSIFSGTGYDKNKEILVDVTFFKYGHLLHEE